MTRDDVRYGLVGAIPVLLVAAVLFLMWPAQAEQGSPEAFLEAYGRPTINERGEQLIIDSGHQACRDLRSGVSRDRLVDRYVEHGVPGNRYTAQAIEYGIPISQEAMAALVDAAPLLCPDV